MVCVMPGAALLDVLAGHTGDMAAPVTVGVEDRLSHYKWVVSWGDAVSGG
jgi:hypothetical protein